MTHFRKWFVFSPVGSGRFIGVIFSYTNCPWTISPLPGTLLSPPCPLSDVPICCLPPRFFFNNKVIVDIVRKIQFLVDVYVPEGLSLGRKSAADRVAHSWHWGQLPRKPVLPQNNCTALSSWFSFLSWEGSRKTNAFCPLPSLYMPGLLHGAMSEDGQGEDGPWA